MSLGRNHGGLAVRRILSATFQHGPDGWHIVPGSASVVAMGCLDNGEDTQINCNQVGNFAPAGSPVVVVPFDQSMNPAKTLLVGVQESEQITVVVRDAAGSGIPRRIRILAPRHCSGLLS